MSLLPVLDWLCLVLLNDERRPNVEFLHLDQSGWRQYLSKMGILFHAFFRDLINRFSAKRNLRTCQKRQVHSFTKILTRELIDFHTYTMFFTNSMICAWKMILGRFNWRSYLVLPVWQNCPYWLLFSKGVENSRLLSWLLTEKRLKTGSIIYSLFTKNTFLHLRETHHRRQERS